MDNTHKKRGRKPKISKENSNNIQINIQESNATLENEVINVPKKRGRKPKPKEENLEPKVYKKRGRKPKPKSDIVVEKIPKKRGRKPKENLSVNNIIVNNVNEEQIILHLPIKSSKINNNTEMIENKLLTYDPSIKVPLPYEPELLAHPLDNNDMTLKNNKNNDLENIENNPLNNHNVKINIQSHSEISNSLDENNNSNNLLEKMNKIREEDNELYNSKEIPKNSFIMLEFKSGNLKKKWPNSVKISCFWCTYNFENSPFGIPIKKVDDTFYMFGNFCCPQCAAAYIFENKTIKNKWESYSLLNMLYSDIINPIKIAPDKMCLRKFGGNLSIEEYRNICNNNTKNYKIVLPPMLSIIPSMEEIVNNNSSDATFVPIDFERIKKADETLRLKRNKPLPDSKNTLENCMNLRYV